MLEQIVVGNNLLARYLDWSKQPRKQLPMLLPAIFAEFEDMNDRVRRAFMLVLFLDETKMKKKGAVCFVANRISRIREE
ncbi:MAG: hypothetical protein LBL47_03050 [Lactobacillus sp.]|jgi:hypothetical protein|nr:hypothetical protein [Lactobacillus sp.]